MVKYKEFIREKLQKLNNLPKKWQQIIICILVIIVAIIYCFSGEEKTKIAVSEKVENKNTILQRITFQEQDVVGKITASIAAAPSSHLDFFIHIHSFFCIVVENYILACSILHPYLINSLQAVFYLLTLYIIFTNI